MELSALRAQVAASRLLTEEEKTYWTERLPRMNPQQIAKLKRILAEAASIPWNEQIKQYIAMIAGSASSSKHP